MPVAQPAVDPAAVTIRPMREDDVPLVAGLHHRLLFDTLNSRLGTHFLGRLYGALLVDPDARCWVALSGDRRVAFLSATRDLHRTDGRVTRAVPWRERLIAGAHVAANPHDLGSFLSHRALLWYAARAGRPYASITTVGVAEEMWGAGLAVELIDRAREYFASAGVAAFHIDTMAGNDRAVALYRKAGFSQVGSILGNQVFRRRTAASP